MYEHVSYHLEDARMIREEILADTDSKWFHPSGSGPGIFDRGRMRFVNRNLNYFYFENMFVHALKNDYEFNPHYPKTLEFCNRIRSEIKEEDPFGRMCLWKMIPNGYIMPHKDAFRYHMNIRRYIFCLREHASPDITIRIKKKEIKAEQGLLFSFNPAIELHEFINTIDTEWMFFGFDYWKPTSIQHISNKENLSIDTILEYDEGFGRHRQMYMSPE